MNNKEINISDIIRVAVKNLWLLIIAAIVGAVVAFCYSNYVIVPQYRVGISFLVDTGTLSDAEKELDQLEAQRQIVGSRYQVPSYVKILNTRDFADAVLNRLNEMPSEYPLDYNYSAGWLESAIRIGTEEDSETFDMTVTALSSKDVLSIARCIEDYAEEYIVSHKPLAVDTLRIIDHARPVAGAFNINTPFNILVGILLGVVLVFVICFFVEINDTKIKTGTGITEVLGIPIIGEIPAFNSADNSNYKGQYYYTYKDADSDKDLMRG